MQWYEILGILGIPTIIFSILSLIITRIIKKSDEKHSKQEAELKERQTEQTRRQEAREKRVENFLLAILAAQKSTNTLASATAKAVQRIPDAKCNGDMKKALQEAEECQKQETELLITLGIHALNK